MNRSFSVSTFYSERQTKTLYQKFQQTTYHLLQPQEEIEYDKHDKLLDKKFQHFILHITSQLNFLLYLGNDQFWNHLEIQGRTDFGSEQDKQISSLRVLLEGCLTIFIRRAYKSYNDKVDKAYEKKVNELSKIWVWIWSQFKKIVLFVFYRISNSKNKRQLSIMYEHWYLDTTKMLDICMVYGEKNPDIVKKLISNVYNGLKQEYEEDYEKVLLLILRRLEKTSDDLLITINFKDAEEIEKQQKRYQNLTQILHSNLELLFIIVDVLFNLQAILDYFPSRQKYIFIEKTLIFKRIILIYYKLRQNCENRWHFGPFQSKFKAFVKLVNHQVVKVLSKSLKELHSIMSNSAVNTNLKYIKTTFINICYFTFEKPAMLYEDRQNAQKQKLFLKYGKDLISCIILFHKKSIFNIQKTIKSYSSKDQRIKIINKMQKFEEKFRQEIFPQYKRLVLKEKTKFLKLSECKKMILQKEQKQKILAKQQRIKQKQAIEKVYGNIDSDIDYSIENAYVNLYVLQKMTPFQLQDLAQSDQDFSSTVSQKEQNSILYSKYIKNKEQKMKTQEKSFQKYLDEFNQNDSIELKSDLNKSFFSEINQINLLLNHQQPSQNDSGLTKTISQDLEEEN